MIYFSAIGISFFIIFCLTPQKITIKLRLTKGGKMHWLTRRLKELKKSKRQLALLLNVHPTRMNDLEKGDWKFQVSHIKKAAKFLEFEKEAFLDFIAGDISENELWEYKARICVSQEDFQLLEAVKNFLKNEKAPQK